MYYYGVKLHGLGFRRLGKLPYPEQIVISKASDNDLTIYKQNWAELENHIFFGDKIYQNEEFFKDLKSARKLLAFSKESIFSSSAVKFLVF